MSGRELDDRPEPDCPRRPRSRPVRALNWISSPISIPKVDQADSRRVDFDGADHQPSAAVWGCSKPAVALPTCGSDADRSGEFRPDAALYNVMNRRRGKNFKKAHVDMAYVDVSFEQTCPARRQLSILQSRDRCPRVGRHRADQLRRPGSHAHRRAGGVGTARPLKGSNVKVSGGFRRSISAPCRAT
jgi:hypothetical protein